MPAEKENTGSCSTPTSICEQLSASVNAEQGTAKHIISPDPCTRMNDSLLQNVQDNQKDTIGSVLEWKGPRNSVNVNVSFVYVGLVQEGLDLIKNWGFDDWPLQIHKTTLTKLLQSAVSIMNHEPNTPCLALQSPIERKFLENAGFL